MQRSNNNITLLLSDILTSASAEKSIAKSTCYLITILEAPNKHHYPRNEF